MQEQKIELILNLPQSDSEAEQQQLAVPKNSQLVVPLHSFDQLNIKIQHEIIKKYKPVSLLYQTQRTIVVKCLKQFKQENEKIEDDNRSEVVIKFSPFSVREGKILENIHKKSTSKHIVKCQQFYEQALVNQFCEQTLAFIIQTGKHLGNEFCMKLLSDCTESLQILQKLNIVHFDIKPSNILYREKNGFIVDFVLTDFGSCVNLGSEEIYQSQLKEVNDNIEFYGQSYQYYAPQSAQNDRKISQKCDIWGLGCVLFECVTGQTLMPLQICTQQQYNKNFDKFVNSQQIQLRLKRFSYPSQCQLFGQLIKSLLKRNPQERPNIQDLKAFLHKNSQK